MVVQHNMQAMNANRMLGITSRSQAKATEKLSSGYKINRAADDAAGLSISEKMRQQIRGLDQASTNAQDGISAVQTAEGALTEVHAMLQRMNELAVQASNGTNSETDRQSIQDEIEQLTTEIDRVAETTKFNETYLLKGNGKDTTVNIDVKDAGIAGELIGVGTGLATFKMDALKTGERITIGSRGYTIGTDLGELKEKIGALAEGEKMTINGTEYRVVAEGQTDPAIYSYTNEELQQMVSNSDRLTIGHDTYVAMTDGTDFSKYKADDALKAEIAVLTGGDSVTIDGVTYTVSGSATAGSVGKPNTIGTAAAIGDEVTAMTTGAVKITYPDGKETTFNIVPNTGISIGTNRTATDMEAEIDKLKDGAKVEIDGIEYTVNSKDADGISAGTLSGTSASIQALITAGATVQITKNSKAGDEYIVGTAADPLAVPDGIGDTDASVITKEKAYQLIGEEILKASSVGCDPGSDAVAVTEDGTELAKDVPAYELIDNEGNVTNVMADAVSIKFHIQEATVEAKQGLQFTLHVGADADESNKIALTIDAMDAAGLGIKNMNVVDNTGAKATYAIDAIADAIERVSATRSELGAVQNRLEHTIANLDNVVENTTAAESEIRDTDMAEAMVEYSKNNILQQAGQSMLAQANQATQGVLSLLQ